MRYSQWKILPPSSGGALPLAILAARGIAPGEETARFIEPPLSDLHDPFLLPDMDKAVKRIEKAAAGGEKIAVYGDYDVDGVTAVCLMVECLRSKGADCVYFIPNRIDDGYGLHAHIVRRMKGEGVSLIITVDVGIVDFEAADTAKELGIDLIITDHHTCAGHLPDALAAINPRRADSLYPNRDLAGVGVAFKLAAALESGEPPEKLVMKYGGLAALGTVADIMPLTGENRVLAFHGINVLASTPRLGISCIMEVLGFAGGKRTIDSSVISYQIAPMINAAGRLGSADTALELLLTDDVQRARYLASALGEANTRRRELETEMYSQAETMCGNITNPAIVLSHTGWHQGVTGIVASKLMVKYGKPVFIITLNGVSGKGTARCPRHISLTALLERCADTLTGFGGHSAAAGFTVETARLAEFENAVQNAVRDLDVSASGETLLIDAEVESEDLTVKNAEGIAALKPFGAGNPEPVLLLRGVYIKQIISLKGGRHLRLMISAGGAVYPVICFGFEQNGFRFRAGDIADIAFCLSLNHFRGVTLQLELKDIR